MEKIDKLYPYSFMLATFVVALHTIAFITNLDEGISREGDYMFNIMHFILLNILVPVVNIAVPFFFAISGYLFSVNYTLVKTIDKYKSRVKSLVVPYLIWNCISVIWYMALFKFAPSSVHIDNPFEPHNVLLGIFCFKYNYFWFIGFLIIYQFISPFLYILLKDKKIGLLIVALVFILYVVKICHIKFTFTYNFSSFVMFIIGFYCGIHWKKLLSHRINISSARITFVSFIVFLLVFVGLGRYIPEEATETNAIISCLFNIVGGGHFMVKF